MKNNQFDPNELQISPGDSVMWTNDDDQPHNATGVDGTWGTGEIAKGNSVTLTFPDPVSSHYQCTHPHTPPMKGTLVVH
jgi:plastocyanin